MTDLFVHEFLYFRVTYFDCDNCFPLIECFVYVGKNLSDEDKEDTWYFQPSADYGLKGSILKSGNGEHPVVCINSKDALSMLNVDGLVAEIDAAQCRKKKLDTQL